MTFEEFKLEVQQIPGMSLFQDGLFVHVYGPQFYVTYDQKEWCVNLMVTGSVQISQDSTDDIYAVANGVRESFYGKTLDKAILAAATTK